MPSRAKSIHGRKTALAVIWLGAVKWSVPADRNGPAHGPSEKPFANFKGVTCLKYGSGVCLDANHLAVFVEAPDVEIVLLRSTGEATGHRDGVHGSHVGHIRIIAGLLNLPDHVEGSAGHDFGADIGIDQEIRLQAGRARLLHLDC